MNKYLVFSGHRLVATGDLLTVALETKNRLAETDAAMPLVFDASSGRQIDLDVSGSRADLQARYPADLPADKVGPTPAKRGRPKLGVVGREVTLLPTHWRWLDSQRGGASAALRRLVNRARRDSVSADRVRESQDSAFRFMNAIAGDIAGFEESIRALYAGDRDRFDSAIADWPPDLRATVGDMAADAFAAT